MDIMLGVTLIIITRAPRGNKQKIILTWSVWNKVFGASKESKWLREESPQLYIHKEAGQ